MNKIFRPLALLLTLFSLAGCGLKGPLYFPPADKTAAPPIQPVSNPIQSDAPDRNNRGDTGGPTQVNY